MRSGAKRRCRRRQPDPDAGDLYAETYLSRAPVLTTAQVNAFVQKVIAYETPADPTYLGNTLFLGEVLFPANWDTSQVITMDGAQLSERHHHDPYPARRAASWCAATKITFRSQARCPFVARPGLGRPDRRL
jgi:hypothetical protein